MFVKLETEDGVSKGEVLDPEGLIDRYLPSLGDLAFPLLRLVDPYGDTVFNQLQVQVLLAEWDRIIEAAASLPDRQLLLQVRALALQCENEPHTYLRFMGD